MLDSFVELMSKLLRNALVRRSLYDQPHSFFTPRTADMLDSLEGILHTMVSVDIWASESSHIDDTWHGAFNCYGIASAK